MVDEESPGPAPGRPRVVKKVVKKTVVRPAAPGATRPVPPPAKPRATAVSRVTKVSTTKAATKPRPARPSVDLGGRIGTIGSRGATALRSGGSAVRRAGGTLRHATGDRVQAARSWRIPAVAPVPAAVVTGLVVGLLLTGLGALAMRLFTETRGTSAGGGLWGGLAVVVIVVVVLLVGSRLLDALGSPQPLMTVFLALTVVALVVMLLFIDLADTAWAWLIIPGLSVLGHLAAAWLLTLADGEGEDRETA